MPDNKLIVLAVHGHTKKLVHFQFITTISYIIRE